MLIAYCWATGVIEFGTKVPKGALEIARGEEPIVRRTITGTARVSKDNRTLLVPGLPESGGGTAAVDALIAYVAWLKKYSTPSFRVHYGRQS